MRMKEKIAVAVLASIGVWTAFADADIVIDTKACRLVARRLFQTGQSRFAAGRHRVRREPCGRLGLSDRPVARGCQGGVVVCQVD